MKHKLYWSKILNFAADAAVFVVQNGTLTKLFGLGHLFWAVAFIWLVMKWKKGKVNFTYRPFYRIWLAAAMVTLAISLPLDAHNVISYLNGTTAPLPNYYSVAQ